MGWRTRESLAVKFGIGTESDQGSFPGRKDLPGSCALSTRGTLDYFFPKAELRSNVGKGGRQGSKRTANGAGTLMDAVLGSEVREKQPSGVGPGIWLFTRQGS